MKRLLVIIALFTAAATAPLPAMAQDGPPAAGRQAPLSRVLATIAARQPGRHLNTTMGEAGGRPAYFVQWQLADGRVVIFVVDAESGQIIGRQGG
ncbi:hypothetical protein LJR219_002913 [Phenylobacterium sp. LjRoot219]|uniref:PepSY domain-containing protein n=1 Tax=Phenylobacterium sp. LjRoot219 TaxID=3342283 RepID=UPI003ED034D8